MTDLIVKENNLPTTLEDLSKFVLIGRDKLQAVRAEISALQKLNVAEEVLAQKRAEQSEIGAVVLLAEMKCGELLNQMPKATANNNVSGKSKTDTQFPDERNLGVDDSDEEEPPPRPKLEVAKELGFNKNQVSQFQTLADNPEIVRQTIAEAVDKGETPTRAAALENIQQAKKPHVYFNNGNNEWYTPKTYIDAAREVLGTIDLDPASSEIANETIQATKFYTAEDDGLAHEWHGNIWLNPPYSTGLIEKFADKLIHSDYQQAIVLVNNSTDTTWFAQLTEIAAAVIFPKGRVKFLRPDGTPGAPLQGQAILYFGEYVEKFKANFEQFGRCWQ